MKFLNVFLIVAIFFAIGCKKEDEKQTTAALTGSTVVLAPSFSFDVAVDGQSSSFSGDDAEYSATGQYLENRSWKQYQTYDPETGNSVWVRFAFPNQDQTLADGEYPCAYYLLQWTPEIDEPVCEVYFDTSDASGRWCKLGSVEVTTLEDGYRKIDLFDIGFENPFGYDFLNGSVTLEW